MAQDRYVAYLACSIVLFVAYIFSNMSDGLATEGAAMHWAMLGLLALTALTTVRTFTRGSRSVTSGRRESGNGDRGISASRQIVLVRKLAEAIDVSEPAARGRSYRVSQFCLAIGRKLGMRDGELLDLEYASLLHDIGRTALHYDVLVKPKALTSRELDVVKSHPQLGYEILKELPGLERAAAIVHAHHEQPDGGGYPRGLVAEAIPLGSRIIMAVTAFDAMTSDRPYRRGLTPEEAYAELRSCSEAMFFGEVVEALITLHASREIFDGFDAEELKMYAGRQYSSRAIESYVAEQGLFAEGVPATMDVSSPEIVPPETFFADLLAEVEAPDRARRAS